MMKFQGVAHVATLFEMPFNTPLNLLTSVPTPEQAFNASQSHSAGDLEGSARHC